MALGDTLTTNWQKNGVPQTPVVTHRLPGPPPETDEAFIDRHCQALYDAIVGSNPPASMFVEEDMGLDLQRESGWSDTDYCREWKDILMAAA